MDPVSNAISYHHFKPERGTELNQTGRKLHNEGPRRCCCSQGCGHLADHIYTHTHTRPYIYGSREWHSALSGTRRAFSWLSPDSCRIVIHIHREASGTRVRLIHAPLPAHTSHTMASVVFDRCVLICFALLENTRPSSSCGWPGLGSALDAFILLVDLPSGICCCSFLHRWQRCGMGV